MASIHTEFLIDARPEDVWAALRDWAAPHERLFAASVRGLMERGAAAIKTTLEAEGARGP